VGRGEEKSKQKRNQTPNFNRWPKGYEELSKNFLEEKKERKK